MSTKIFKILSELASLNSPQLIYSYRIRPLYRFGSLSLSAVLLTYGVSFLDVFKLSATQRYRESASNEKSNVWLILKTFGPIPLAALPFILSAGTLYIFSRVVTGVTYIPHTNKPPSCELTRRSALFARPIREVRQLGHITRAKNVKIYTGQGPQGIDDKATFSFFLIDRSPNLKNFFSRFYILPRSGSVWKSDGRLLVALFGEDGSEKGDVAARKMDHKSNEIIFEEVRKLNGKKTLFHTHSKKKPTAVKNIVNKLVNK
ncbi:hypothetical protein KAFR_0C04710 [Kazachstania africana CBS 2517]|uniref:Uncharacterized protein n=1 Tax=Kazachstania africana (strain ATCC 22294 / BCRC 22015 / CBS 2517 / CECT 1963 / NBRC 1671 / NRRL Y-8276) TaxID=1071382 RepID=H2ASW2_KAZAF|nr:hypothetical protein KAFR_0C04710 [Kazachstania africana CBS 2517]CCF57462.1 hypothetical protein KAFR_0C04710 [Kazachstania africana CBS 2517]